MSSTNAKKFDRSHTVLIKMSSNESCFSVTPEHDMLSTMMKIQEKIIAFHKNEIKITNNEVAAFKEDLRKITFTDAEKTKMKSWLLLQLKKIENVIEEVDSDTLQVQNIKVTCENSENSSPELIDQNFKEPLLHDVSALLPLISNKDFEDFGKNSNVVVENTCSFNWSQPEEANHSENNSGSSQGKKRKTLNNRENTILSNGKHTEQDNTLTWNQNEESEATQGVLTIEENQKDKGKKSKRIQNETKSSDLFDDTINLNLLSDLSKNRSILVKDKRTTCEQFNDSTISEDILYERLKICEELSSQLVSELDKLKPQLSLEERKIKKYEKEDYDFFYNLVFNK